MTRFAKKTIIFFKIFYKKGYKIFFEWVRGMIIERMSIHAHLAHTYRYRRLFKQHFSIIPHRPTIIALLDNSIRREMHPNPGCQ